MPLIVASPLPGDILCRPAKSLDTFFLLAWGEKENGSGMVMTAPPFFQSSFLFQAGTQFEFPLLCHPLRHCHGCLGWLAGASLLLLLASSGNYASCIRQKQFLFFFRELILVLGKRSVSCCVKKKH